MPLPNHMSGASPGAIRTDVCPLLHQTPVEPLRDRAAGFIQCEERRTLRGLLRQVAGVRDLSALSRFFAQAPWSARQVAQAWLRRFRNQMIPLVEAAHAHQQTSRPKRVGRPKKTVVTGSLVIDDSPHEKPKGKAMEGLGVHSSTTEGKQVRGHSLLTGLYLLLRRRCPLPPLLYRQRVVAQAEGVRFWSKIDPAEKIISTFKPVPGTHTHVLVDAWYTCKRLWKVAREQGFAFTEGLKGNRQLRVEGWQVVQRGLEAKVIRGRKVRVDTIVVRSPIKHPTDIGLLPMECGS